MNAADPTIEWDALSPASAPGSRITASGKYSLPAPAGGVSWMLTKIVVEIKRDNETTWSALQANVDMTNKTWSILSGTMAAGKYNVRVRMEVKKMTQNPLSSEDKVIEPIPSTPRNVQI